MVPIMAKTLPIMVSIMLTYYRASFGLKKTVLSKSCLSFEAQSVGRRTAPMGVPKAYVENNKGPGVRGKSGKGERR